MRRAALLMTTLLLSACSYVRYEGVDGRNVEIEVRNDSSFALEYQVIHWESTNRILWIEKDGEITLETLAAGAGGRRSMHIDDGYATVRHDGVDVLLPIEEGNTLVITNELLSTPQADG